MAPISHAMPVIAHMAVAMTDQACIFASMVDLGLHSAFTPACRAGSLTQPSSTSSPTCAVVFVGRFLADGGVACVTRCALCGSVTTIAFRVGPLGASVAGMVHSTYCHVAKPSLAQRTVGACEACCAHCTRDKMTRKQCS